MTGLAGRIYRRIHGRARGTVALAAALAALTAVPAVPAIAAPGGPAAAVAARGASVPGTAESTHPFAISKTKSKTILLLNGDRAVVAGKIISFALAGGGFAASVTELRMGGRQYAVPDAALPFLGHGLDLSLFDVAALPGGATLPVRIGYGGRAPRLPGVTITRVAGGVATGYLTAAGARRFGAALVRQLAADRARASYGSDGLFGGGVTVMAAGGTAAPPRVPRTPKFKMHILTVRGLTAGGKPDTGDLLFLYNADNAAIYGDPVESLTGFYHGTAKFALPSGPYWALAWFFTLDKKGDPTGVRVVFKPRVIITGNATITLAAKSATSQLTFRTAQRTSVLGSVVQLAISDKHGNATNFALIQAAGMPEWFSPTTQRLAAGKLEEFVDAWLRGPVSGPPGPDSRHSVFAGTWQDTSGLIKAQHYALPAGSLAAVPSSYASDAQTAGGVALSGFTPLSFATGGAIGLINQVSVPARLSEYLQAGPGVFWQNQYFQSFAALGGGQSDIVRDYAPGPAAPQEWNVYPLHTPLNSNVPLTVPGSDGFFGTPLSATRNGNDLALDVTPFTDDTLGHTGTGFAQGIFKNLGSISGSFEIDVNGKKLDSGKITPSAFLGTFFDFEVLPAAPSTVSFTLNARRTGNALLALSPTVSDTWAWQSAPGPAITVPGDWFCADGSTTCQVQPLLTLGYKVAHIGLDGTAPAGAQQVTVSVGHQALGADPAIASTAVQFSLDGKTWRPASMSGSGGTWLASFDAPPGSFVSLRTVTSDVAGGTLTETIGRAYATATEAARAHGGRAAVLSDSAATLAAPVTPAGPAAKASATSGYRMACAAVGSGAARCLVLYAPPTAGPGGLAPGAVPQGWGARDIQHAYKLPVGRNSRATVAVVEAFDTPKLETYLNAYRKEYGLGPCTVANGCFRKVGQSGSARKLPHNGVNSGWDLEATLDVDMVSAACPRCKILVVEANSPDFGPLAAAENTAARLGAVAVSNSYGARETGFAQSYAKAYNHPGHVIVASSGDFGYTAASFPANLASVTAVGGTNLFRSRDRRGWGEQVWNTGGLGASSSGCSAYVAKPRWQHDGRCPGRTVADVAAVAMNLAIYNKDWGGWVQVGGTSASSPLIAGIIGLAGNGAKLRPGYEYAHAKALFDVTGGNNDWFFELGGKACGKDYLCVARKGYDAPTGLGTPDGIGAF